MGLEALKLQFYQYYEQKNGAMHQDNQGDENLSLFISQHEKEFKDYLVNVVGLDPNSLNDLSQVDLNTVSIDSDTTSDKKPSYSFKFITDIDSSFSQSDMDILGALMDKDKDGVISKNEEDLTKSFLSLLDGNNNDFTGSDIKVIKDYIASLSNLNYSEDEIVKNIMGLDGISDSISENDFAVMAKNAKEMLSQLQEASDMGIQPNSVMEENGGGSDGEGSSGTTVKSPAYTEKMIQNMSIDELEQELINAQEEVNKSKTAYEEELEKTDKELSDKIKDIDTRKKNTTQAIQSKTAQQTQYSNELNAMKTSRDEKTVQSSNLDSQINALSDADDVDENGEKISHDAEIAQLEAQKRQLDDEIAQLNIDIPKKEQDLQAVTDELEDLNTQMKEIEEQEAQANEELRNLAEANPQLKTLTDAYDEAVKYQDTVSQTLELRKSDQQKENASNRPDAQEAPRDYRGRSEYDFTNLPMTYNLDGKEYNCVGFSGYDLNGDGTIDFKPNSWEEVQRYFACGGVENIGQYGDMQCHNYSDLMGQFVLGVANNEFVNALYDETNDPNYGDIDRAGLLGKQRDWNPRNFAQCTSATRDDSRAIIENELQNGRPCVVSVPYPGGSHYVLAVGMSKDGDILIWDSYNGSMEKLGCSSNSDTTKLHRNMATGHAVMVFCNGYHYDYSNSRKIDYWQYVNGTTDYVFQAGYK